MSMTMSEELSSSLLALFQSSNGSSSTSLFSSNSAFDPSSLLNLTFPIPEGPCEIGSEADTQPVDISIFQHFQAPSQPRVIPSWEQALKIVFYLLAFVVTLVGNGMVILIICLNRRMRSTINVLLLNQATSDLLVAAVCMWVHLGNSLTPEWPFGPFVCKVNTFCQVTAVTGSVLTLTVISLERFTGIVFPLKGRWSACVTGVIIVLTWLLAALVASPHLFVRHRFQVQWQDRLEVYCAEHWPRVYKDAQCHTWQPGKIIYYLISGIVMYLLPVVIMVVMYGVVTYTLITRKIPGTLITSTLSAQEKAKRKVIKMLVAVLVCFVVCWTPQQCLLIYDLFRPQQQVPMYLRNIKYGALYLAYLNSALNPILYGGFNDNFRRGFRDVFHCLVKKTTHKIHPVAGGERKDMQTGKGSKGIGDPGNSRQAALPGPSTSTHRLPTVSSRVSSHRLPMTEAATTKALFADPTPLPCPPSSPSSLPHPSHARRLRSVTSDDTMDINWHALQ